MNAPSTQALLLRCRNARPARNRRPAAVALLALPALLAVLPGCTKSSSPATVSGTQPGPRTFTVTCLRALPQMSQGTAVAASTSGGATRYGVCVSGADKQMQSWWKLQGTTWKVLGSSISADATVDDVANMHYGIPSDVAAALLEELANVRAEAAKHPIHFGVPTKRPQ